MPIELDIPATIASVLPLAPEKQKWQHTAFSKRADLNVSVDHVIQDLTLPPIPTPQELPDGTDFVRSHLSPRELEITETFTASTLLHKIAVSEYTSVEVCKAFCRRAALVHKLTNCLTDIFPNAALIRAKELDHHLSVTGKTVGPLHGLPISLKDQFRVCDRETSLGYVSWLGRRETKESESWMVTNLENLGAIFYVKTNVPTSLMALETNNNIFGYTLNGKNRQFSSAGSSGGEASLLALRGSIIGLGSDVGASIRLPCGVSGLYGLKPSHGRLPYKGISNSMDGHETVPSVIGPMGHSSSDLRLLTKAIIAQKPWLYDTKVIDMPWRQNDESDIQQRAKEGNLVFGLLNTDGIVNPHPPIQRALQMTSDALREAGHEIIEWSPPSHAEGVFDILWNTFAADGGKDIHDMLAESGEPAVPEVAMSYGDKLGHLPTATVNDLWNLQHKKWEYQMEYAAYWNSTATKTKCGRAVDAILMPVYPSAGFKPGKGVYFGYTGILNVLDFTASVLPVTTVDKTIDLQDNDTYVSIGDLDQTIHETYDPVAFHDMPVGIQIVGRRLQEERVLALTDVVVDALHARHCLDLAV